MRFARFVLLLTLLPLASCVPEAGPTDKAGERPAGKPATPSSDFAMPVTAPMAARKTLLRDLGKQNEAARERERQLDAVIDQNR